MAEAVALSARTALGRPYRVPLPSGASPAAVIAALDPADRPGVLWGGWFGGGVLVVRRPAGQHEPATAVEAFARLDEQPDLIGTPPGLIGGGWLAVLGFAPGSTVVAFHDSLLRWDPRRAGCSSPWAWTAARPPTRRSLAYWRRPAG